MARPPISKSRDEAARANMPDYARAIADFSWDKARAMLDGLAGGALNIAHEAVDRHVAHGRGAKCALRWLPAYGDPVDVTYEDLSRQTNKFANVLRDLDIKPGERVYALLGRRLELHVAALGALKTGAIFCPLFSAFGPEPTRARMEIGEANILITTSGHYHKKVAPWRAELASLRSVIVVDQAPAEGALCYRRLMDSASADYSIAATQPNDPALLHFTSGTTGKPKGVVHAHEAVVAHYMTGFYALDLHADDVFWCTADPGWVTGMSYGVIAPLALGVTSIIDEAEFDALRWRRILREEGVNVWYTAPTAIRMMMKAAVTAPQTERFPALRFLASVGEPLNPEAVEWSLEAFGRPFHDNWWQTETGGIMIANYASMEVRPGSMGKPLPGIEVSIVERAADGVRVIDAPNVPGELALKPGWPSMMRAYLHQEERYKKCFVGGWYLTGDLATRDADGYYWFVGRADDLIKSAGHLIGPFEVESALMEHPAVAEAAVIGLPDPVAGEVVKAFVVAKPGQVANEALRRDILGHARKRLGPTIAPKIIAFIADLPKTRSGKIMRRLLKARELGLPEGDLSTLEGSAQ